MKRSLLFTAILLAASASQAQGYGLLGANFAAPTINDKDNVRFPTTGEIVFDTSDGNFWGKTEVTGNWVKLSGTNATDGTPVGSVLTFAAATCPEGYVSANGASYERQGTYSALFNIIGTAHGAADSDHFNVPDYQGRFLRGISNVSGNDPDASGRTAMKPGGNTGNSVGSVQADDFKSHTHTSNWFSMAGTSAGGGAPANGVGYTTTSNATGGNETRPKNAYVNYCIKY